MSSLSPVPIKGSNKGAIGDAAMTRIRSGAEFLAAIVYLAATLGAIGAGQAQTTANAGEGKRVQVLQIVEANSHKESSIKRSKSAATSVKNKAVPRKTAGRTRSRKADGAAMQLSDPNTPIESATADTSKHGSGANTNEQVGQATTNSTKTTAALDSATPVQENIATPSTEQAEEHALDDDPVALGSFVGQGNNVFASAQNVNITLPTDDLLGASSPDQSANGSGARNTGPSQVAGTSSLMSQLVAMLSGGMLAAAFGWILVKPGRRAGAYPT
jgi:hypothetical protein